MKMIETQWWSMPLGEEWNAEVDEDTVIIGDEDGVGILEITVLELEGGDAGPEDLQELAQQLIPEGVIGKAVTCGQWRGKLYEYANEDACRDWLLLHEHKVMLMSYTCDLDNQGMDDSAVDEMLAEMQGKVA
jgi:hypothetical protein